MSTAVPGHAQRWQLLGKRAIDLVCAGVALVVLAPGFLFIAALIKSSSRGPVFFSQERVGLHGKRFLMHKFRTMNHWAERELPEMTDLVEWDGPVFRIRHDPRVTRVGRVLRRYCVDEFPQLVNVLAGDMSLVGPRPHLPQEVARYQPWHRRRLACKPGLTCLWQISDRHRIGFDEWIRMDLDYIESWSIWRDLQILLRTPAAVLSGGHEWENEGSA